MTMPRPFRHDNVVERLLVQPPNQKPSCKLPCGGMDVRGLPHDPHLICLSTSLRKDSSRGDRVHHLVSPEIQEQLLTSPSGKRTFLKTKQERT